MNEFEILYCEEVYRTALAASNFGLALSASSALFQFKLEAAVQRFESRTGLSISR